MQNLASAGTIFLQNSAEDRGELIIDNRNLSIARNTSLLTFQSAFRNLIIRNKGALNVDKQIAIENDFLISGGGRLARE